MCDILFSGDPQFELKLSAIYYFQVNCLSELCKMGGLESNTDLPYLPLNPNQWWRLPLSLLYHHGLVHGMLVLTLQLLLGKSIEAIAGWFRMAFLYLIPGLMALLVNIHVLDKVWEVTGLNLCFLEKNEA